MHVLLVEDGPDDVAAVRRLIDRNEPPLCLTVLRDGLEASAYAAKLPGELPDLILLDINLPGLSGIEVLRRVKAEPRLRDVPVVVLSGSDSDEDVRAAQDLGAHSYLIKPLRAQDLGWIARSVASYRTRLARLSATAPAGEGRAS
jgi:two-component system response regulator